MRTLEGTVVELCDVQEQWKVEELGEIVGEQELWKW